MIFRIHSHSSGPNYKAKLIPWVTLVLTLTLMFGYKRIESYLVQPKVALVLGGSETRERFAAKFAIKHPDLHIWVSSGSPKGYAQRLFTRQGIDVSRLHLDYKAVDTVTNFTTLVDQLEAQDIDSVYLITSDYHMRRARLIGDIVFGSRGIVLKPLPVPSEKSTEPLDKALRDGARALLWLMTGQTGAELGQASKRLIK
ncbi:MAG: YdcF family protein [Moorea sp. SIO3C2]|nr:YdcF family protein [Moorena sp. SIO3C2]